MVLQHFTKIHPVELVPGENQHVFMRMVVKMNQPLPDRIRRALVPFRSFTCFLSGDNLNKSPGNKIVKPVTLLDMTVERRTQVLG